MLFIATIAVAFMRAVNKGTKGFWNGTVTIVAPILRFVHPAYPNGAANNRSDEFIRLWPVRGQLMFRLPARFTRLTRPFDNVPCS